MDDAPPGPSSLSLFLPSTTKFSSCPSYPSIYFLHSCFEIKHLTWSKRGGLMTSEGWLLISLPPPGPDSLLSVVVIHYLYAPRSLSLCRLSIFSIRLTLVFIQFTFCCHNLLIYDLFFILVLFSSLLFVFFCLFFFSSLISPPILFPFLPHRSGCSCGTRRGKSVFVASSQATLETLLLQS